MWIWLGCTDGGPLVETTVAHFPDVLNGDVPWEIDRQVLVGLPLCEPARAEDFSHWPGGAQMRIEVEPLDSGDLHAGDPLTVVVTGANPDDTIEVYAGALCSLDCPQMDGGCFQPAGATPLATWQADAYGSASGEVDPPKDLLGQWIVFQATAPLAKVRYVSQPLVDTTSDAPPPPLPQSVRPTGPVTLRGQVPDDSAWTFVVPAGRRSRVTVDIVDPVFYQTTNTLQRTVDGVTTAVAENVYEDLVVEDERTTASRYTLWMREATSFRPETYNVDFALLPLNEPISWGADADGDGVGDPSRIVGTSRTPLAGASADLSDCDDGDPASHPAAAETCGDGIDQDCDGADRPCVGVGPIGTSGTQYRGLGYDALGASLHTADLDGDGVDEILAGGASAVSWFDRGEMARLAEGGTSNEGYSLDVDGDGSEELVVLRDVLTALLFDDAAASVPRRTFTNPTSVIAAIEAADVTGDGALALLVSTQYTPLASTLTVFVDPVGTATEADSLALGGGSLGHAADFDGDGIADWLDGTGCLWPGPIPYAVWDGCEGFSGAIPHDVDGDGRPDVIGGDGDVVKVRHQLGSDYAWATLQVGVVATEITWLVDADAGERSWIGIRDATGAATYVEPIEGPGVWEGHRGMLWTAASVGAGDFDGDGTFDLTIGRSSAGYATEPAAGEVWILWSAFDAVP